MKASPQLPDYLIVKNDTIPVYELPLSYLNKEKQNSILNRFQFKKDTSSLVISTNLWRGYQAFWKIIDDKLFLVGLKGAINTDIKIFAKWFSKELIIPKDKMLKWDGIFRRTYLKEEIFSFRKGHLKNLKSVENYIDLENGISRYKKKIITDTIFQKVTQLDWNKLSKCGCDDKYWIEIDSKGKIDDVKIIPFSNNKWKNFWYNFPYKHCERRIKKQLQSLQFDIIKWNGKPYKEKFLIELFYSVDKKLENFTETLDEN